MLSKLFSVILVVASYVEALSLPSNFGLKNASDSRIIGGRDALISEVPFQISLEKDGKHRCGGAIISNSFVITAAHCTYNTTSDELTVRVGTSFYENGGVAFGVKTTYRHPQFNIAVFDYDISILKLAKRLRFSKFIAPIRLPGHHELAPGTPVQISGWGTLEESSRNFSSQLQLVKVKVIDLEECRLAYADYAAVADRMFCAGVTGGERDSCNGDSGGPLIAFNTLYGIISWGFGCGRAEFPGVYSNVVVLRRYIKQITGL